MNDDELDVVEFTDDEGNSLLLQVVDNFFYNGEEFAVLTEFDECDCEECCAEHGHSHDHANAAEDSLDEEDDEQEQNLYIMKVNTFVDDDGEEMEEFTPVDDDLMEKLIEIVQTRYFDDEDEDDDGDDEDNEEEDEE